ncbi:MAG: WD40 repeat domain-containing protein, partial [bacterium]
VNSVSFSSDGKFVISGSWDYTLKLWNVQTGDCVRTFE